MTENKKMRTQATVINQADQPLIRGINISSIDSNTNDYWSFGSDNMFPYALAVLSRSSSAHRRILNDKADYVSGKGFSCGEKDKELQNFINHVNNKDENLRNMLRNSVYDYLLTGNGYIEVVTNRKANFLSFFHQDSTKCRLSKDKSEIILAPDWSYYNKNKVKTIPLFPNFKEEDGCLRSMIRYIDYEPMFENYGIPDYIAGLNVAAIAYKTDKWNISRLDNSFQFSGVLEIDADSDDDEAKELKNICEKKFAGKPGQVLFLVKNMVEEGRGSKFTPIQSTNEGDWKSLHEQSSNDIVVAHSWFRTLSGLDYSTGFNADRILNEYQVAMSTIILNNQERFITPIKAAIEAILKIDTSSLQFVNRPPIETKPGYMKVWEARKADGLEYDEKDHNQQMYLANLNKNGNTTTDNSARSN